MNLLRDIQRITKTTSGVFSKYIKWSLGETKVEGNVRLIFSDGLIAFSKNKVSVSKYQEATYAEVKGDYQELIDKYNISEDDVFLGRDGNYILFRNGNIAIKTSRLNLECDDVDITITNAITVNGVALTFVADKMLINGKEVAVIGGDVNPLTNKIEVSGQ